MQRLLITALVLLVSGCSSSDDKWKKDRPKTVPATGVVTLDGVPLTEAQVVAVAEGNGTGASGMSDAEGKFSLDSFAPDPGAVPGTYKVMIVKSIVPEVQDVSEDKYSPPTKATLLVPVKYTDFNKSGLTAVIPEGGTAELKFELKK